MKKQRMSSKKPDKNQQVPIYVVPSPDPSPTTNHLTQFIRKPADLSVAERRAVLDSRHSDDLPPDEELRRVIQKLDVAMLERDPDAMSRAQSCVGTLTIQQFPWSRYINKGKKFAGGGSTKMGKEFEPKRSIRTICNRIDSFEFEKVMKVLRNADDCRDLYESTSTPIDLQIEGVDHRNRVIRYIRRGSPPTQIRELGFARLRNILSEIKNH